MHNGRRGSGRRIKQYHKEGRALRTETTINNTRDFGIGKQLKRLPALRQIGFQTNRRLLGVQTISHDCSIGEETFEKVIRPIEVEGQRASALRTREGKVYPIGQTYENGMPLFKGRDFKLLIGQDIPPSKNNLTAHIDYVSTELGQVGAQLDGLGHVGIGDLYYKGNNRNDFAARAGLKKLGVENAGAFITRGVMIDVAAYKGVERRNSGYEVTLADVKGALARQRVGLKEGHSVFLRTGCAQLWMKDNATYVKGEPDREVAIVLLSQ